MLHGCSIGQMEMQMSELRIVLHGCRSGEMEEANMYARLGAETVARTLRCCMDAV